MSPAIISTSAFNNFRNKIQKKFKIHTEINTISTNQMERWLKIYLENGEGFYDCSREIAFIFGLTFNHDNGTIFAKGKEYNYSEYITLLLSEKFYR